MVAKRGSSSFPPQHEPALRALPFTDAVIRAAVGGGQTVLTATLLEALARLSGFDATFVSVVDREQNLLRVSSSYPTEGPELVPVGASVELPPDYPERAYLGVTRSSGDGGTPEPDSLIAKTLGLRTYASVPIITADYRLYAMLCGASRAPMQVSDDVIAVMEYFSRIIVDQMARDVARAADARAEAAERDLQERLQFLAEAEHMLKSPLFVVSGFVEAMRRGDVPEAERLEVLDTIAGAANEVIVQVQRLLEEVAADVRSRDMHPVVKDLVEEVRLLVKAFNAAGGGHRVRFKSATPHLSAELDPALFAQIMAHLLDNAVKYSDPDSTIEVSVRPHHGHGEIRVYDEGSGLPPAIDVFAPFQRGLHTGAAATSGVGLGLHIVRNLARAMGGEVNAENNTDRGATFTVILPATDPTSDLDPATALSLVKPPGTVQSLHQPHRPIDRRGLGGRLYAPWPRRGPRAG